MKLTTKKDIVPKMCVRMVLNADLFFLEALNVTVLALSGNSTGRSARFVREIFQRDRS